MRQASGLSKAAVRFDEVSGRCAWLLRDPCGEEAAFLRPRGNRETTMENARRMIGAIQARDVTVSIAEVLRDLELTRRKLAIETEGCPGAFTGFTSLAVNAGALSACVDAEISLSVTSVARAGRATAMDFEASVSHRVAAGWESVTVITGRGVTIYPFDAAPATARAGGAQSESHAAPVTA
jgi:hypothetical protein